MAEYLKLTEVARRLDVSEKTARRYVKTGTLPSVFVGGAYRVSEADLAEFLEGARVEPGKAPASPSLDPSFNDVLDEERRNSEDAWRAEYLARADEMLDEWEGELEEKLALADNDLAAFFDWLDEIRKFGRPHITGVVSGYMATTSYRLEAVLNAKPYLDSYDDLWRRIEAFLEQTTKLSEEDEKRFRELSKEAREIR